MKTIYAVSSGSYSDYGVHCLFESSEDADKYVSVLSDKHLYDDYRIETFQYFEEGEVPVVDQPQRN